MSQYPDHTTIQTEDGIEVIIHSNNQRIMLMDRVNNTKGNFTHVKVARQMHNGDIVLHLFYEFNKHLRGYLEIIGKRGGCKTYHNRTAYREGTGYFLNNSYKNVLTELYGVV